MKYHYLADEENQFCYVMIVNQRKKIRLYNKHRQVENTKSGLLRLIFGVAPIKA
jgi:hypothetical protein